MQYRTTSLGDQFWVRRLIDGSEATAKFITHDGLAWDEDEGPEVRKLTGIELALNYLVVAAIKFNHWLVH